MKKHVFLSFNVECGVAGTKNTVMLLDSRSWDDYSPVWMANDTHESIIRQMAEWLIVDRLRIEDVKTGVRQ